MKMNDLKERMKNNGTVYGLFINSGSTIAVEIAGLAGFDFVLIDSEHGPTAVLDNRDLIAAAEYRDTVPIVRVSNGSDDLILRTLDVGAHGVMVPQVNTVEKAEGIARAAHYSPEGNRGVATTRASDYGFAVDYFKKANERTLVIVQCENVAALSNLEDICSVEGVDMVFLGPYDYSSSIKKLGQVDYESIKDVVKTVLDTTKRHGKFAGIFTKSPEEAKMYKELGFNFIIVGTDISCIANGCRNTIDKLGLK